MSDTAVIWLAFGIMAVVGLFIAGIAFFIFRYHQKPSPEPTSTAGPGGPVTQIPTKQISVVRSSLKWLALGRYAMRGTLTITPDGFEYTRPLRGPKRHPYANVSFVEEPDPSHGTILTIHLTNGWGIVALTGTPQSRHLAVVELSRWVRVAPAKI
ncbi:hypothetical protein NF556_17235 [Ornithinimicrobium faecis]|uniref:DUF2550 domain-containing protein n=1 Tax=Ornithinimicrobium faecis TaxID=2934158 RepID=A0ABY4YRD2_9MICO|nr:hypothetical protein [Ornithinimicrobium sp. HY1793]USQ79333.1 hypothetical protein NF556_17235 [Ornithinimicrobium sp. HY1793]